MQTIAATSPPLPRMGLARASVAVALPAGLALLAAAGVALLGAEKQPYGGYFVADANAIAAIVLCALGGIGLLAGFACGIAGLVLAHRNPYRYVGKGIATSGLVLNGVIFLLGVVGLAVTGFFTLL